MKTRVILGFLVAMVVAVASGCAKSPELIKAGSVSTRNDVFRELSNGGAIPQGYAHLHIVSSLKTHRPGIYPFEKKSHGTAEYRLLINIDGQATQLQGSLKKENVEARSLRDPEEGDGIRYSFRENVRLKAGAHRIAIAIPEDEIAIEQGITLAEGTSNGLVLEPLYGLTAAKQRPGYYWSTSFREGLKSFRLILNGKEL